MTDEAYTGVPLHEGTIVLEADGIPGQIVLEVTQAVGQTFIKIRCCVSGTHTDCVPDGAVLELEGTPVLPVIDWCVTEQEIELSAILPESRLRMVVTDPSMDRRELHLTVIDYVPNNRMLSSDGYQQDIKYEIH